MEREIELPIRDGEYTRTAVLTLNIHSDSIVDIFPNITRTEPTLSELKYILTQLAQPQPAITAPHPNPSRRALPTPKPPFPAARASTTTPAQNSPVPAMPPTSSIYIAARILDRVAHCNPGIDRRIILAARPHAQVADDPTAHWHYLAVLHAMAENHLTYSIMSKALSRSIIEIHASLRQASCLYSTCTFFKVACDMYAEPTQPINHAHNTHD